MMKSTWCSHSFLFTATTVRDRTLTHSIPTPHSNSENYTLSQNPSAFPFISQLTALKIGLQESHRLRGPMRHVWSAEVLLWARFRKPLFLGSGRREISIYFHTLGNNLFPYPPWLLVWPTFFGFLVLFTFHFFGLCFLCILFSFPACGSSKRALKLSTVLGYMPWVSRQAMSKGERVKNHTDRSWSSDLTGANRAAQRVR